ncbi:hypothetical protein [Actinomadura madurae]|uniref:hypothetical protein n=1 Tax=Actinomadura madurae TaxID=1993 RepID=UPI0020D25632|nr:hypothetical protein [Actinomadura madurae]MCP9980771.1 hypothetical protein [Actinomadura madurae]
MSGGELIEAGPNPAEAQFVGGGPGGLDESGALRIIAGQLGGEQELGRGDLRTQAAAERRWSERRRMRSPSSRSPSSITRQARWRSTIDSRIGSPSRWAAWRASV